MSKVNIFRSVTLALIGLIQFGINSIEWNQLVNSNDQSNPNPNPNPNLNPYFTQAKSRAKLNSTQLRQTRAFAKLFLFFSSSRWGPNLFNAATTHLRATLKFLASVQSTREFYSLEGLWKIVFSCCASQYKPERIIRKCITDLQCNSHRYHISYHVVYVHNFSLNLIHFCRNWPNWSQGNSIYGARQIGQNGK